MGGKALVKIRGQQNEVERTIQDIKPWTPGRRKGGGKMASEEEQGNLVDRYFNY